MGTPAPGPPPRTAPAPPRPPPCAPGAARGRQTRPRAQRGADRSRHPEADEAPMQPTGPTSSGRTLANTLARKSGSGPTSSGSDSRCTCTLEITPPNRSNVHLVATLAREDGRPPRVWNDYRALAEVAHEFEAKFGLRSTAGRDDHTAARRPGVKEAVTAERAGRRELPRDVLRQRVKAA